MLNNNHAESVLPCTKYTWSNEHSFACARCVEIKVSVMIGYMDRWELRCAWPYLPSWNEHSLNFVWCLWEYCFVYVCFIFYFYFFVCWIKINLIKKLVKETRWWQVRFLLTHTYIHIHTHTKKKLIIKNPTSRSLLVNLNIKYNCLMYVVKLRIIYSNNLPEAELHVMVIIEPK